MRSNLTFEKCFNKSIIIGLKVLFVSGPLLFNYYPTFSHISNQPLHVQFHLNHIDICVDSITFSNLMQNTFIRDSFAFVKVWSDSTGSEILLLGQQSFIHVFPEKGFYTKKNGACFLIHHSLKWKETEEHLAYLQKKTSVPVYVRPYISKDTHIDYINTKDPGPEKFIKTGACLQNPSEKDYYSYGYDDSDLIKGITQQKYMYDYVGKQTSAKLFHNITQLKLNVSALENNYMHKLLTVYGYKKMKNYFVLNETAVLLHKLRSGKRRIEIEILLSSEVLPQTIPVSKNLILILGGKSALLKYQE